MSDLYPPVMRLAHESLLPLASVCHSLEASRSSLHAWQERHAQPRDASDIELSSTIKRIFHRHQRLYNTRRMALDLAELGFLRGVERVGKIMKSRGLITLQPRSFKPRSTESRHRLGYSPNLLLTEPTCARIDQVWVGEFT